MKDLVFSIALANLVYMEIWLRFFYKGKFDVRYLPTSNSFLALIVGEILIALVFWSGILLFRKINHKVILKIARFIFCFIMLYFFYYLLVPLKAYVSLALIKLFFLAAIILLIYYRKMTVTLVKIVMISFPFVIVIFSQATLGIINEWGKEHTIHTSAPFINTEVTPRVLWLIFDETDQRVAFAQRPPNLKLPALDRFRHEAFQAENAYPPGGVTAISMPSIIDGKVVNSYKEFDDHLQITYKDSEVPVRWGSQPNIFSKAKALKINSAVFGFLPYAKAIQEDVMYCGWCAGKYDYGSPKDTLLANLGSQFYGLIKYRNLGYTQRLRAHKEIFEAARHLVADQRYQLVLIHFSIPHLPTIGHYRKKDKDHSPEDYKENLIVMDQTFAKLREIMESKGFWDNTTVILSSDHWLRKKKYIYDHQIDHRVPFILKLAGHKESIVYEPAFNTIITHDLILALLNKEIITDKDLIRWMEEHRNKYPINTRKD